MALNTNVRAAIAGAVGLVAGVALIASLYLQQRRKTGSKDSPKATNVETVPKEVAAAAAQQSKKEKTPEVTPAPAQDKVAVELAKAAEEPPAETPKPVPEPEPKVVVPTPAPKPEPPAEAPKPVQEKPAEPATIEKAPQPPKKEDTPPAEAPVVEKSELAVELQSEPVAVTTEEVAKATEQVMSNVSIDTTNLGEPESSMGPLSSSSSIVVLSAPEESLPESVEVEQSPEPAEPITEAADAAPTMVAPPASSEDQDQDESIVIIPEKNNSLESYSIISEDNVHQVELPEDSISFPSMDSENQQELVGQAPVESSFPDLTVGGSTEASLPKPEERTLEGSTHLTCQSNGSTTASLATTWQPVPEVEGAAAAAAVSQNGNSVNLSQNTIPFPGGDEIRDALETVSKDYSRLSFQHARTLIALLGGGDCQQQEKVLGLIGNAAAFTENQNTLRKAGCLEKLHQLLRVQNMAMRINCSNTAVIKAVNNSISNLAVNQENQTQLGDCIPTLIDMTLSENSPETIQVASLQALMNLSVTSQHHGYYTQIIQRLYEYLDVGKQALRLQSLRVLVNLSCNPEMVPSLLAAKAPSSLLELLNIDKEEDILLRWMTVLANILQTTKEKQITSASLPTDFKAPSPETMYSALYGLNHPIQLRSKAFVLSKHSNDEIRQQATRIHSFLH